MCENELSMEPGKGSLLYADADSILEDADYAILGVAFEKTVSHRKGTSKAPHSIREESYNIETYHFRQDFDVRDVKICDIGTIHPTDFSDLSDLLVERFTEIADAGAFPIVLGGEHSITPFVLREVCKNHTERASGIIKVVSIDAHLDFRESYLGETNSHASAMRNASAVVGMGSVLPVGVRSFDRDEFREAKEMGLGWIDSFSILEGGLDEALLAIDHFIGDCPVYLTIDMDGIDPAYVPGVGTPEPFGLAPLHVLAIIEKIAERLVGMDVVEICPPFDNGNTSALACRLIGEAMAYRGSFPLVE